MKSPRVVPKPSAPATAVALKAKVFEPRSLPPFSTPEMVIVFGLAEPSKARTEPPAPSDIQMSVVVRSVEASTGTVIAASVNHARPVWTEPVVPTAPEAFRLPLKMTLRLASARVRVPTGTESGTRSPSITLNCSSTPNPITRAPDCETSSFDGLRTKLPARVKWRVPATSTMKKPSPSIATSVATPVAPIAPLLKLRCVPATVTPRPTWPGLVPPVDEPGAVPSEKLRLKVGVNCIRFDLNAVVFTFEMLLPMTSSRREFEMSPERPVKSAVVLAMVVLLGCCRQALARRAVPAS